MTTASNTLLNDIATRFQDNHRRDLEWQKKSFELQKLKLVQEIGSLKIRCYNLHHAVNELQAENFQLKRISHTHALEADRISASHDADFPDTTNGHLQDRNLQDRVETGPLCAPPLHLQEVANHHVDHAEHYIRLVQRRRNRKACAETWCAWKARFEQKLTFSRTSSMIRTSSRLVSLSSHFREWSNYLKTKQIFSDIQNNVACKVISMKIRECIFCWKFLSDRKSSIRKNSSHLKSRLESKIVMRYFSSWNKYVYNANSVTEHSLDRVCQCIISSHNRQVMKKALHGLMLRMANRNFITNLLILERSRLDRLELYSAFDVWIDFYQRYKQVKPRLQSKPSCDPGPMKGLLYHWRVYCDYSKCARRFNERAERKGKSRMTKASLDRWSWFTSSRQRTRKLLFRSTASRQGRVLRAILCVWFDVCTIDDQVTSETLPSSSKYTMRPPSHWSSEQILHCHLSLRARRHLSMCLQEWMTWMLRKQHSCKMSMMCTRQSKHRVLAEWFDRCQKMKQLKIRAQDQNNHLKMNILGLWQEASLCLNTSKPTESDSAAQYTPDLDHEARSVGTSQNLQTCECL
eukprot:764621-Hanusia_phi.AAC.2